MDAAERMMTIMDKPLRRIAYFPPHDVDVDVGEGSVELLIDVSFALTLEGVLCCVVGLGDVSMIICWMYCIKVRTLPCTLAT